MVGDEVNREKASGQERVHLGIAHAVVRVVRKEIQHPREHDIQRKWETCAQAYHDEHQSERRPLRVAERVSVAVCVGRWLGITGVDGLHGIPLPQDKSQVRHYNCELDYLAERDCGDRGLEAPAHEVVLPQSHRCLQDLSQLLSRHPE